MKKIAERKVSCLMLSLLLTMSLTGCVNTGDVSSSDIENDSSYSQSFVQPEESSSVKCETDGNSSTKSKEADELLATIFFASDYQYKEGYPLPENTLSELLDTLSDHEITIENAVFGGDYSNVSGKSNYNFDPNDSIEKIKRILKEHTEKVNPEDVIFVQGNHDMMTGMITPSGLHEHSEYLVYVLNTQTDYPWHQGMVHEEGKVQEASQKLEECLNELIEAGESRPVFIAAHVPLHYTGWTSSLCTQGDNLYASYIFDVVNQAAEQLDIVFLVGHNHARGWDSYLGGGSLYLGTGDQMILADFSDGNDITDKFVPEELNFTYLNYGYLGFVEGYADTSLSCTVAQIYPDRICITRYDSKGMIPIGAAGAACQDPDDSWLIPEEYYSRETAGAVEILRHQTGSNRSRNAA